MKSRKLKAILAIASAIAMLTVSMAGFAATVNTLTKYNLTDGKVDVQTTVTGATDDSLITYLVQDEASKIDATNKIVYIDQKKVSGGSAVFNYVIDKDNIASLSSTTVSMGTNNPSNTNLATSLAFQRYETQTGAGELYTVTYSNATIGNNETTVATITAADGYEIDFYTITGDTTQHEYTGPVTLAYGKDITSVVVAVQEMAPVVSGGYTGSEALPEGGISYTQVINVESAGTATIAEIGLYWNGMRYPAMVSETEKATTTAAVQIIDPNTDAAAADAAPYYIVGNKMYKVDGTVWFE